MKTTTKAGWITFGIFAVLTVLLYVGASTPIGSIIFFAAIFLIGVVGSWILAGIAAELVFRKVLRKLNPEHPKFKAEVESE